MLFVHLLLLVFDLSLITALPNPPGPTTLAEDTLKRMFDEIKTVFCGICLHVCASKSNLFELGQIRRAFSITYGRFGIPADELERLFVNILRELVSRSWINLIARLLAINLLTLCQPYYGYHSHSCQVSSPHTRDIVDGDLLTSKILGSM